jgi:beta-lactamase regulating signal transducer with metallopeptidase domain
MNLVHQSAFLKALGWSLLDSLWQMGVLWLLYVALTANGKKFTAAVRHNLALLSLGTGSLWFVFSLVVNYYKAANPSLSSPRAGFFPGISSEFFSAMTLMLEPFLPYLSVIYLTVMCFLLIRLYYQYRHTRLLAFTGTRKASPEIRVFLQQLAARMGIKKDIRIWISSMVDTPLTVGFWKPVILLPVAIINNLSVKQTESVILHELFHIQRNDFLLNILIAIVDTVLFFNPFAGLLRYAVQKEREHSCDDIVLQFRYEPGQYAEALLVLEQQRMASRGMAIAATGKSKHLLLARVKRILTNETVTTPVSQRLLAFFIAAFLVAGIGWYNPGETIVQKIETVPQKEEAVPPVNKEGTRQLQSNPTPDREKTATTRKSDKKSSPTLENEAETDQVVPEKLEEKLAKLLVNDKLQAMISALSTSENPEVFYVTDLDTREFTIPVQSEPLAPEEPQGVHPFVPSNSLRFHVTEDRQSAGDLKSGNLVEKVALEVISDIDLSMVKNQLAMAGEEIDIKELKSALKNVISSVNWGELDKANTAAENAPNVATGYLRELALKKQDMNKERMMVAERLKRAQAEVFKQKPVTRSVRKAGQKLGKRIVVI